ncbi:MAG TPA: DUF885 domain-containing protein [Caulobacteraceae bacterium]
MSRRGAISLLIAAGLPGSLAAQGAPAEADAAFSALSRRWLKTTGMFSPVWATQIGDHSLDAELDDLSPAGRAAATTAKRAILADLEAMPAGQLTRANQIDAAILGNALRYEMWSEDVLQSWAWDPLVYSALAGDALYSVMARDFAPLPTRLRAATARMEKLPALLAQARANLDPARVPKVHAQTAATQNKGLSSLVADLIVSQAGVLAPEDRGRLDAASVTLSRAVEDHQRWLETTLEPAAAGDFRLGAKLYDAKLAFALESPLDRREIRRRAEAAVIATRREMYVIAAGVLAGRPGAPAAPASPSPEEQQAVIQAALDIAAADHPDRDQVVAVAKASLAQATDFVRSRDLITLPAAPVKVILMPEFRRGVAVAYCDPPGPLDKGQATFYAVSPLPEDWTEAHALSFLREYNRRAIADIATHEAMPGHYVQLAHSSAYPSTLRAVLWSGVFVEGWAVYGESMMAQEGFLDGDPLYRLVVLKIKLRSITNAILDQGVHVDGLSREDALKLMTATAFQEEGEAAGKWVRVSVTSAQLPSYFVGSEEHWDIRREAEKRWGQAFGLKRYHDTVLAFGSPPARFVRAEMFGEPIGGPVPAPA